MSALVSATPLPQQLTLLALPPVFDIASNAHARCVYGALAQELACAALALDPIRIDGRCDVCFDAASRDGTPYEIKSVHHRGKAVLYDWRMEKEHTFPALRYILVVHRARGCRSATAMLAAFHRSLEIWELPAALVHAAAAAQPLRTLSRLSTDPRNGYSRPGYSRGYRNVPLAPLSAHLTRPTPHTFHCYGQTWEATLRAS